MLLQEEHFETSFDPHRTKHKTWDFKFAITSKNGKTDIGQTILSPISMMMGIKLNCTNNEPKVFLNRLHFLNTSTCL